MEFKINKDGVLEIKRAGKWTEQACRFGGFAPYQDHKSFSTYNCSDSCPLFGEPELEEYILENQDRNKRYIKLEICKKTLHCDREIFKDERK